ncbi:MAG: response regulator [Alphaproteobacteria bacterium]|nr:response regulator [Alphaproteobacteria bacterium]
MAEAIPFSRTISIRLLRLLLPLVSLALLVLFAALEVRYYVAQRAALVEVITDQLSVQEAAFLSAIWEYDDQQIIALVSDVSNLPFISSIAVYDSTGELMAHKGEYKAKPESEDFRQHGAIVRTVDGKSERVGELVLTGHTTEIWSEIGRRILLDILILLVMSAALTAVTFFATRNVIGRPLDRLRDAIDRVDAEKVYTQVEWASTDELGALVQNFNRMQRRRADAEAELKTYQDSLEHTVAERTEEATLATARMQAALNDMKEAHNDLTVSQSRLNGILDYTPALVYLKGLDGRYQMVNKTWSSILGLGDVDAVGKTDAEIFSPDIADMLIENDRRVREEGAAIVLEETTVSDGVERIWASYKFPIMDDADQILAVGGVSTDITEIKKTEAELVLARDAAESATRAKSSFLAAMSHEIRTPMNGVIGMIDLLWQDKLEAEQRKMLGTIRSSAFSLLQIINDILDFSKIEAGKLDLELLPISIRDVVEGVAETLLPEIQKKQLRLRLYVDPDIPARISADQVRLRQILFNLMGNAIKFTNTHAGKTGEVVFGVHATPPTGSEATRVTFSIKDSGIGMTEEGVSGLFKPFAQAEGSTTRRFGGTGLGLSICKNLTDIMGGEIVVESEYGKGSTFNVSIPFSEVSKAGPESDESDLKGLRVLTVVDDPDAGGNVSRYLSSRDALPEVIYDVGQVAGDVQSAQAADQAYDVVVFCLTGKLAQVWQAIEQTRKGSQGDIPRYVILDDTRTETRGQRPPDMVIVEAAPMMRSSFFRGVAMAAGRASPDIDSQVVEEIKATRKAPSIEAAMANRELILIAEDNLTNQDVIRRQLNLLGYTAEIVDDGEFGFEAWRTGRYGLILTDCHMPNMDGYEMTEAIRGAESDTENRIPIVAITANALQGEADRCLACGMDDYLSKPLEMIKLRRMLAKWLPHAGQAETATPIEAENPVLPDSEPSDIESPVNPRALKDVFGDDHETFCEILADFVDPATSNVKEITDAADAGDAEAVGAAAHKLKSSSRAVGAEHLGTLCELMEKAGKSEDTETINELTPKVLEALAEVLDYIKDL